MKPRSPTHASTCPDTASGPASAVKQGIQCRPRLQLRLRSGASSPFMRTKGSISGAPSPPRSSMSPFAPMCSTETLPSAAVFSSRSGRETYSFPVGRYFSAMCSPRNLI